MAADVAAEMVDAIQQRFINSYHDGKDGSREARNDKGNADEEAFDHIHEHKISCSPLNKRCISIIAEPCAN
jgi:hypothetical protein